jgi:large subunit ribosomal protein L47
MLTLLRTTARLKRPRNISLLHSLTPSSPLAAIARNSRRGMPGVFSSLSSTTLFPRTFVSTSSLLQNSLERHPLDILFRDDETLLDENGKRQVGRSWRPEELRLKSFEDLHALWFVLLKERNMLQTERIIARKANAQMVNPARLKKVRASMARLKTILGERSREHQMAIVENEEEAVVEVEK